MPRLRDMLLQRDPVLAKALDRSWKIAREEWLPALGVKFGSYNSYPHLRNVERYLDDIVPGYPHLCDDDSPAVLTGAELYLLLAAVLFHDIGRTEETPGNNDHAMKSEGILTLQRML